MEFLKKLLRSYEQTEAKKLPWISLIDEEQLQHLIERSKTKIQIIFKFSNRCSINNIMLNRFVNAYELSKEEADLYYLDIINYRNVSNAVSNKFQVRHESPQVLLIKNGVVVNHASHGEINGLDLKVLIIE